MINSISDYILEEYGIKIKPGKRDRCIFCGGHNTLSITPDDTLAKCFRCPWQRHIKNINRNLWVANSKPLQKKRKGTLGKWASAVVVVGVLASYAYKNGTKKGGN